MKPIHSHASRTIFFNSPSYDPYEAIVLTQTSGFFDFGTNNANHDDLSLLINGVEVTRDQVTLIEGTLGKLEIDLDRNTFHYDLDAGSLELLHLRDQELKLDSFKLELSASSGNVIEELRFLVSGINDAPLTGFENLPPAVQDENYLFDLEVYDPEGQTAIISPIEIPDWPDTHRRAVSYSADRITSRLENTLSTICSWTKTGILVLSRSRFKLTTSMMRRQ